MTGDREAWDQFVDRTAGIILAAIRRTAGSQLNDPALPDTDDIVQAVFVRLVNHDFRLLRSFDPNRASLVTWLTLVTRSTTIDSLRRRKLPTVSIQDHDSNHQSHEEARDEGESLDHAVPMHLLTSRQQLVLKLLFEDERSVAEAASILGIGEQTIRSTKHKALERLRASLKAGETADET